MIRFLNTISYAVVLMSILASSVVGCAHSRKELAKTPRGEDVDIMKYAQRAPGVGSKGWYVYPPADIIRIPHDAFVRWEESDEGLCEPRTEWFWNGKSVGADPKGSKNICKKLLVLPKGSKVLFFPRLDVELWVSRSRPLGESEWRWGPFPRIVSMRELVIIFSVRDEKGNVCSVLRPQYERWLKKRGKQ